jgi:hypothetical protein
MHHDDFFQPRPHMGYRSQRDPQFFIGLYTLMRLFHEWDNLEFGNIDKPLIRDP